MVESKIRKSVKIRLYVADDHVLFRKGLIRLIQSFRRIGEIKEASNGRELIKLVEQIPPDVILVDLHMPVMGGDEVCRWVEENYPEVKVVMLTMEDSEEYVQQLISMGAHAYISKAAAPDEVEKAIYSVYDNDFYHNDLVVQALRNFTRQVNKARKEPSQFTKRELDIIQLICEEYTMREIADRLGLSESTIQNYRVAIMGKMSVKNTAGLVKFALTKGLVK
ncbi:MAG TPA: response regulator transcription factor [Cyclobacteriaceae bacterium]|nr:response regulator transcription factor [Cyclobacteriaceae bacterium]